MAEPTHDSSLNARLLHDVALWQADGLIPAQTAARLRERYNLRGFGLGQVLRYLGIVGLVLVVFGILGMIAEASGSETAVAIILVTIGGGFFAGGVRMAHDELARYAWSSRVVLTVGTLALSGGTYLLLSDAVGDRSVIFAWGLLMVPAIGALAYICRITFLLSVALLGFFHWVGSWSSMWGRSTYVVSIQDPQLMAAVAVLVIGVGLWHEHALQERTGRFFVAYQWLGLLYLNLSLLILSIDHPTPWALVLTAAAAAEIVVGARLHNRLILGFGVTFTFINGFTRFYETFWESTAKGTFFVVAGLLTLAAGYLCELALRRVAGEQR